MTNIVHHAHDLRQVVRVHRVDPGPYGILAGEILASEALVDNDRPDFGAVEVHGIAARRIRNLTPVEIAPGGEGGSQGVEKTLRDQHEVRVESFGGRATSGDVEPSVESP